MADLQVATAPNTVRRESLSRRVFKRVMGWYMRTWHHLRVDGMEHLPPRGPALVLCNHTSLLDVPTLMAADPYPDTIVVVKSSMFKLPLVRQVLDAWGAISVDRDGRDTSGVRALLSALRAGRMVAMAGEGTRSRTGRLQPINPVLAKLAVTSGVPVIPLGIVGSFEALPRGALFPRRHPIYVRVGEPFTLPRGTSPTEAAQRIQDAIAALLPPERRPA